MKPIDIEHEVLLALRSTPGQTIHAIRRRITTAQSEGPGWRPVANAVMRIEHRGWVRIVAEQEVNGVWHPAYGLTDAGREQADRVRSQRINAQGGGAAMGCEACGSRPGQFHSPECPAVDAFKAGRIPDSEMAEGGSV